MKNRDAAPRPWLDAPTSSVRQDIARAFEEAEQALSEFNNLALEMLHGGPAPDPYTFGYMQGTVGSKLERLVSLRHQLN